MESKCYSDGVLDMDACKNGKIDEKDELDREPHWSESTKVHVVAIVGLGPKGFYCLERLLAEFNARTLKRPLHIHVFNCSPNFGASPVYDPEQLEYIAANISVGEVDLWSTADPPNVVGGGPDFMGWYHETFRPSQKLTGVEYLSRGLIGRYFIEGFRYLLAHVPENASVVRHVAEVVDIRPNNLGYKLKFVVEQGRTETLEADKILLATGHACLTPGPEEDYFHRFARQRSGITFIPHVYPLARAMEPVATGATVAMKGIGLTFIDAILELTEGRGGRFEQLLDGSLSYRKSGREPRSIFPFCRSGLPILPKPAIAADPVPFTFLTDDAIADLRRQAPTGKLVLERDVWPLVELEMQFCYYRVEMKSPDDRDRLIACGSDAAAVYQCIEEYLTTHPDQARFDYRQVLDPIGNRFFATGEELNGFVGRYLKREIARAIRGPTRCGIRAAMDIWYQVRKTLGSVMQFGGFTPESHRKLIEFYFPLFKRVALGPPIMSVAKLSALVDAGLLNFSVARSPTLRTDATNECFELHCEQTSGTLVRADTLIDARCFPIDISRDAAPLFQNLFRKGMIRLCENKSLMIGRPGYRSGAIDMTPGTHFVVDRNGTSNKDIAVIGIPTEGNLVGNFDMTRDNYSAIWAAEVIQQLHERENKQEIQRLY